jgi:signal transduction histidine kinase
MTPRLKPDTLFGRLLAALLGAVGLTLLVIVLLIVRERRDLIFRGSETAALVAAIAATSESLAALPADARATEIQRLRGEPPTIERSIAERGRPPEREDVLAAIESVRTRLVRELPRTYRVHVQPARPDDTPIIRVRRTSTPFEREPRAEGGGRSPAGERPPSAEPEGGRPRFGGFPFGGGLRRGFFPREVDVIVTLPDGADVTFRADVPRAAAPLPSQIFVELGALTLVLVAVLFFMTRTITRPLRELARAAEAVGRGERAAPLQATGARELRDATNAFNAMQERLHRYLDSRTRVLAAMSHDLRTPLTRLRLRVESLRDATQRERFTADLDEMVAMVTGALNLFRGLNDDEPSRAIDVDALLADVRAEFAEIAIDVAVQGAASAPFVGKPQALKRCLTNLVSNAVKYGGGATVVVEDGAALVLRVRDEGPGIPADQLEQVFEPFYRLESSRNSDTGGTGLGLSIARDVAQAHGGSVTLLNRAPRGLEAVVTLPRSSAH